MTTKEFTRRLDYFHQLDGAALLFTRHKYFIYRAVLCWNNRKIVSYCPNVILSCFSESFIECCDSLYYDKYLYSQFEVDLKYFSAFLARLSKYQYEVLVKSHKCENLLEFLSHPV